MTAKLNVNSKPNRILVMGILNVTPDSFYSRGRTFDTREAVEAGLRMIEQGADILDIGGESSRPGAEPVSADEETRRVLPVIEGLCSRTAIPISIDTTKANVAKLALQTGASIINDITALRGDPNMAETVAEASATVVLMHMQGAPQTMQIKPRYDDVIAEITQFLIERALVAQHAGIPRTNIIVDPGIGFGKTLEHNLTILKELPKLVACGYPVLVGLSRKAFLGVLSDLPACERLEGTIAANAIAIAAGASMIRVHDVKEGRRTADIAVHLRP